MSLNHAQTEAVAHNEGPCMVLAGPGSGKTLTIAKRIEYLIMKHKVRPEEILVITFTKYAAQEMKERTRRICGPSSYAVTFGTFHGIYYGILKWAYRLEPSNLLTDEEKYRMLRTLLPKVGWDQEPETDEEAQMPEEQPDEQQPAPEEETPQAQEGITLSRTDFTLFTQGSTYRLKVTGAKDSPVFASSNPAVATVAEDGTVTAVAPGTAQITVTAGDHTATCVVRCRWENPASEKPEQKPEKPADNTSSNSVDLQAFYDDMTSTYEFQALQAFSGEILDSYYPGMSDVDTKQCLIMGTMMSMNNGEFCLVEVSNSSDVETVKSILQSRVDYMVESGAWYPGPTELWTNSSRVVSNGNYVMMVVHENCDDIVDAFNEYCS